MRLFVALPAGDAVRDEAAKLIRSLSRCGADVKWVEPENLHWTLHFFGETPEDRLGELKGLVGGAAASEPPFELALGDAGAFPSASAPRVVWLGLSKGETEMSRLAAGLAASLKRKGWPVEERPFAAHLTLGRVRSSRGTGALAGELRRTRGGAGGTAERLVLIQSRLGSQGPVYSELFSAPLGGAA